MNRKLQVCCALTLLVMYPGASWATENDAIVSDILTAVRSPTGGDNANLAKMGVLAGSSLLINPGIDHPKEVIKIIRTCYAAASISKQIRNIMACYVMDRKISKAVDRAFGVNTTKSSVEKLEMVLASVGIKNPVEKEIQLEFDSQWIVAEKWLASRNIRQVNSCLAGFKSPECM